ncbi:MAG: DUF4199 domain-containing protein [Bacteroidota bacterium]|nr:DUF4199 domain-containing protein [Bacteroidota bacterium]
MESPAKKVSVAYGIYLGVALILITVLAYAFDLALFTKWWFGILIILFTVIMGGFAASKAKKASTELFTFKKAFGSYFLTIFIGTFIGLLFSFLLFNVVDPAASETLTELTMESTRAMMERFGAPEDQINEALRNMQDNNQFSLVNQLKGYAFQLVLYALLGLIVSLIVREKEQVNV